jgi:hypothetical protein
VDGAHRAAMFGGVVIGALWSHSRPSASVLAAYRADPTLEVFRFDFTPTLAEALTTILLGVLAQPNAASTAARTSSARASDNGPPLTGSTR